MRLSLASSTRLRTVRLAASLCVLLLPGFALGQKVDKSKLDNAARRSRNAAQVLTTAVNLRGSSAIPQELLERAQAIGVFPEVDKLSFLMPKAMLGYGVICARQPGGWTAPAYYGLGSAQLGDRTWVGGLKPDIIVLFMSDKAKEEFQKGAFHFKNELVGVAGPVGKLTPEQENELRAAHVIVYAMVDDSYVKGLHLNEADLGSAVINPDNKINQAIYGLKAREVLAGTTPQWPSILSSVSEYQNALASLSKR
ncbi:MAG TPA: lipid-binding SYLF domain-containing protein [Pyrinomonadaceae bacterium]